MITHIIPFEDEVRQIYLNSNKYIDIWSYRNNFLGTQEWIWNNHGKQAISVWAIDVYLYSNSPGDYCD